MKPIDALKMPFHVLARAGKAKSFVHNPVIGSPSLNRLGLHRLRVALADRTARAPSTVGELAVSG